MTNQRNSSYSAYFKRPNQEYSTEIYGNRLRADVAESESNESLKYQTLFAECFGHHVQFNLDIPPELTVVHNSNRRLVELDGLTSYFLEKLYVPPVLFESENFPPPVETKRNYSYFLHHILENPSTKKVTNGGTEGSNLITHLIGEIGTGKTLLLCKTIRDIVKEQTERNLQGHSSPVSYKDPLVLPVYFDFETQMKSGASDGKLKDINDDFYRALFTSIVNTISQTPYTKSLVDGATVYSFQASSAQTALIDLIQHIRSIGIRLIILFDNMDGYHYIYSKYAFFIEYYKEQLDSIRRNITELIYAFTQGQNFGMRGLSIIFAARKVVYRDCVLVSRPEASAGFLGTVFQIANTDSNQVVRVRMDLFTAAINKLESDPSTKRLGVEYRKTLERLRVLLGLENASRLLSEPSSSSETAITLSHLGHHGNRSLVEFYRSLQLDHRNDGILFDRFFNEKPFSLILLYIAHLCERYTQAEGHFPNLFLVDAMVIQDPRFPLAHKPHIQTYWLKYLILSLVYKAPNQKLNTRFLRSLLCKDGGFEEDLFYLTLGSLSMSRESRCLEPEGGEKNSIPERVVLTDRGRCLMKSIPGHKSAFCFSFTYLQLIVDDYLMSYPIPMFSDIYIPDVSLKYLSADQLTYDREVLRYLDKKMHSVLAFLALLRTSFEIERKRKRSTFEILERESWYKEALPDFKIIERDMYFQFDKILKNIDPRQHLLNRLHEFSGLLNQNEPSLRRHLEEYFESGIKVVE
jgi:hypothetical protein